jgi:hypothetical protein
MNREEALKKYAIDKDLRNSDLRNSNLRNSDLSNSDLRYSNLSNSNLRNSNLSGANLDFSCLPLCCGGLRWKIDARIARQIAYHLCSMDCDDAEFQEVRKVMLPFANKFHRVCECGVLK